MDINKICPHCLSETDMGSDKCSHCGKNPKELGEVKHHLKPMTILQGKYLVGDILGEGGFGITYIGVDINLEIKVAIKEFYPNGYCTRDGQITTELTAYTGDSLEVVNKWKENFIKEARSLARCSNLPGVVGVKDFFQENNTAYIVQEYLEGMTLKELMKASGGKISADQLLPAIKPVIEALGEVHRQGIIHRDISPDNIMRLNNGQMKLLDFGAARDFANENEKSLSVLLKPGYAPEEQYRTRGNQGPWSDIYAMAGTIYKCLTGVTPPEALERLRTDELKSPNSLGANLTDSQEQALLKAMSVLAENRYQNATDFMSDLFATDSTIAAQSNASDLTKAHKDKASDTGENTDKNTNKNIIEETNDSDGKTPSKLSKQSIIAISVFGGIAVLCLIVIIAVISVYSGNKGKSSTKNANQNVSEKTSKYDVRIIEEPDENSTVETTGNTQEEIHEEAAKVSSYDRLLEYAEELTYLSDAEYPVDLELSENGYIGSYIYSNVKEGPVSYIIKDFDNDGDDELLIESLQGYNYSLLLTMYEYDAGTDCVLEQSCILHDFKYSFGDNGYLETFSTGDSPYIFIYSRGEWYRFADGVGIDFRVIKYENGMLVIEDSAAYSGSDGFEDYDFMSIVSKYSDNADWQALDCGAKPVSEYCNEVKMISKCLMPAGRDFMRRDAYLENYTKLQCVGYSDRGYQNDDLVPNSEASYNETIVTGFIIPDSNTRYVTEDELDILTPFECKIARNEILARHGRLFVNTEIQDYFNSQSWYSGYIEPDEFIESKYLNEYEIENMYFIKAYENSHGYK